MNYYVAADGGGTKLQVILYDDNFHIVNSVRMSGTNTVVRSVEEVAEDIERLIEELIPKDITDIEGANLSIVRYSKMFAEILGKRCYVKDCVFHREGETALAAAGVRYGVAAQAGTGSDAFLVQPHVQKCVGGWGWLFDDEGSGYDIGIKTLKAIVYSCDGRGPKTILYDLLAEAWQLSDVLNGMVNKVLTDRDYKSVVASVPHITSMAAWAGDPVALKIYEEAAHALALQVHAVIREGGGAWQGPVVASGGAWKGHPRMFESFAEEIRSAYPEAEVMQPLFEPVAGCALLRCFARGEDFESLSSAFTKEFRSFLLKSEKR